jgi:hypothetical protein
MRAHQSHLDAEHWRGTAKNPGPDVIGPKATRGADPLASGVEGLALIGSEARRIKAALAIHITPVDVPGAPNSHDWKLAAARHPLAVSLSRGH